MHRHFAGLVAFLTSGAVLVMEIVASRLLAPYVGVTLQTYTAIIGVVLTGISLGAFLGGRLADRGNPAYLVSIMLSVGGILVFGSLLFLRLAANVFDGGGPTTAVGLVVCAFLAPATVLSMVSPLLVKASLRDLERTGREVGRISALGTAGAIVGTFVAGFALVATIASPTILFIVGGLLMALGVATFLVARSAGADATNRPSSRVPLALVVLGVGSGATVPSQHTPCQVETAYFCANVRSDGPRIRTLQLDTLEHSAVNLDDDRDLLFDYTKSIGAAIDTRWTSGASIVGLHIGGGGFTIPRYVRATRPGSDNLVIERDPELVRLDKRELGLVTDAHLRVRTVDGRIALRDSKPGSFDLIVGDAFGGEAVPWHLTTREFTRLVRSALKSNGMYALNVIDSPPTKFAKAEVATVANVFAHVAVVSDPGALAGEFGANFIVLASDDPLDLAALGRRHHEVGLNVQTLSGEELQRWVGGAHVLTDAFAPVDQLLTVDG